MSTSLPGSSSSTAKAGLPVELWTIIFREATSIPGKSEFGTNPRAYSDVPCDPPILSSRISADELRIALKARLNMVLVCSRWRDMALPVLYSHFRVRLKIGDTTYQVNHQTLAKDARLSNSVRRFTVVTEGFFREVSDTTEAKKLLKINRGVISVLSLLPRLRIISASPMLFWSIPLYIRSSVAVADLTVRETNEELKVYYPGGWNALTTLCLNFGGLRTLYNHEKILLPSLSCLEVHIGRRIYGELIKTISERWTAPVLRAFSLHSPYWTLWRPFLERHATTLEILNIQCSPDDISGVSPIALPNLRELYLEPGPAKTHPGSMVHAPRLECLGLHRWILPRETVHREAGFFAQSLLLVRVLNGWSKAPPVEAYYVSGEMSLISLIVEKSALMERVDALRKMGGKVIIVCEEEGSAYRRELAPVSV